MSGLRPVAGFTGNVSVFARRAALGFRVVAQDTFRLTGERRGTLPIELQSRGTIVAVLAEGFGNDGAPNQNENSQPGQ